MSEPLLARVATGDHSAFTDLMRVYRGLVLTMVRRSIPPSAAEDVAQAVWLRVWRYAKSYNPTRGTVPAFLSVLVKNEAADYWRRHARTLAAVRGLADEARPTGRTDVERYIDREHAAGRVRWAFSKLSDTARESLLLTQVYGMRPGAAGAVLGLNRVTVSGHGTRARQASQHWGEPPASVAASLPPKPPTIDVRPAAVGAETVPAPDRVRPPEKVTKRRASPGIANVPPLPDVPVSALTFAEREVAFLMGQGLGQHAIAELVCRSAKTVSNQQGVVYAKLGVDSAVAACRWSIRSGLADHPEWIENPPPLAAQESAAVVGS
jgi:RNA polymerase sigma-70 factor (ECF subfamily)